MAGFWVIVAKLSSPFPEGLRLINGTGPLGVDINAYEEPSLVV